MSASRFCVWKTGSNHANHADGDRRDLVVSLVECLLTLHNTCQYARTPHEQTVLAAQIAATDRQLDRLVYALYGLSEEEIRVVEGG